MVSKQSCVKAREALARLGTAPVPDKDSDDMKLLSSFIDTVEKVATDESVHEAAKRGFGTLYS